jgi:hypothetical protein
MVIEDKPAAVTVKVAVAVWPASLPVTVWTPATEAVQEEVVQEPSGAMLKTVEAVTTPRGLE